jgi:hypothetical protein
MPANETIRWIGPIDHRSPPTILIRVTPKMPELLRGADRQDHHPREGRPAIREDAQPQAPPAGLRRERRAFVG